VGASITPTSVPVPESFDKMPKRKTNYRGYLTPTNVRRAINLAKAGYNVGKWIYRSTRKKPSYPSKKKRRKAGLMFNYIRPQPADIGFYKRGFRGPKPKRFYKKMAEQLGPLQYCRSTSGHTHTTSVNQIAYKSIQFGSLTKLRSMVNNYVQVGETDANVEREETINRTDWAGVAKIYIRQYIGVVKFRNNSSYPQKLTLYWCIPKIRTDIRPENAIQEGLDDRAGADLGWETEPMFYPSHALTFRRRYQIYMKKIVRLNPGDEHTAVVKYGPFIYDDDWEDNVLDKDFMRYRTRFLLMRLQGCITHDQTLTDNVGYSEAQVDYIIEECVKYHALTATNAARDMYTDTLDSVSTQQIAQEAINDEDDYKV
jgi:hypothetical protein